MKWKTPEIRRRRLPGLLAVVPGLLLFTTMAWAQEGLTIRDNAKQKWPTAEAGKIYSSACAAVQREFGSSHELRPRATLVLGVDKHSEGLSLEHREIRLAKWDRYMFAQGVVWLAFADLMPEDKALLVSKRAVSWADATVTVSQIEK